MSDLIDTTEMYLRTIFELAEEGVLPMRARIAERLAQSGPTVSQTVARMQRDGLVELDLGDRHIVLTPHGHLLAIRVMRKHRIAECLLVEVIGLPWDEVHAEACRWEHVMSESVERRLVELLRHPGVSPFGNPIPGLDELADSSPDSAEVVGDPQAGDGPVVDPIHADVDQAPQPLPLALEVGSTVTARVVRIGETLQSQQEALTALHIAGVRPGATVLASREGNNFRLERDAGPVSLTRAQAAAVVVEVLESHTGTVKGLRRAP